MSTTTKNAKMNSTKKAALAPELSPAQKRRQTMTRVTCGAITFALLATMAAPVIAAM